MPPKTHYFPFGQPVKPVMQIDRTPKGLFVLGVYASAVHARWLDAKGRSLVNALAVASEPEIFWRGENAEELIAKIHVPAGAGKLVPADPKLNGPSGVALDDLFLAPLGHDRKSAWLCDLLPESRMNPSQASAIERAYHPNKARLGLTEPTVPAFHKSESHTDQRRKEILAELDASKARVLVVLGDVPIQQFIKPLANVQVKNLADLTKLAGGYGKPLALQLEGRPMQVIGLCHPRQAAKLGRNSKYWEEEHEKWLEAGGTKLK